MPVKKGKGCVASVMKEWKAGTLHSGKDGPVVTDKEQAVAIALSMCGGARKGTKSYEEMAASLLSKMKSMPQKSPEEVNLKEGCGCGDDCDCKSCRKGRANYSEADFGESDIVEMLMTRLQVIHGRVRDIEMALAQAMMMAGEEGEIEVEQWMVDKITLAADYISAVADNARYGDGIEVEMEDEGEEEGYAEAKKPLPPNYKRGLTKEEQTIAKREIKETMAKAKKPGTSAKDLYQDWESDKKYKAREKSKGQSMPKSKATEAYERMYGNDSQDMEEGSDKVLREKAEKSGISYGILKKVFERGMAAWQTGHRPGVAPQQWALGRVNSFITGKGKARKADDDLWDKAK